MPAVGKRSINRAESFQALLTSARSVLTELLLDLPLEELHLHRLSVHQQHVARLGHADELHDAFGVCVRTEGHVLDLQLHIQLRESQITQTSLSLIILAPGVLLVR